jgi:hypothetical protein
MDRRRSTQRNLRYTSHQIVYVYAKCRKGKYMYIIIHYTCTHV